MSFSMRRTVSPMFFYFTCTSTSTDDRGAFSNRHFSATERASASALGSAWTSPAEATERQRYDSGGNVVKVQGTSSSAEERHTSQL